MSLCNTTYFQFNYVCLCLRSIHELFFKSLSPSQTTRTPAASSQQALGRPCSRLSATWSAFVPSTAGQMSTPDSGGSLRQLRGRKKEKRRSLYRAAFTHISHSLNPFSNLLMRVTWRHQRRLLRKLSENLTCVPPSQSLCLSHVTQPAVPRGPR